MNIAVLIALRVALDTRENLVDQTIEALQDFKNSSYQDEEKFEEACKCCALVFTKKGQKNKSFDEILEEAEKESRILEQAKSLDKIYTENKLDL